MSAFHPEPAVQYRGYLACRPDEGTYIMPPGVTESDIARLEKMIDGFDSRLEPFRRFILPGGCQASAACHMAAPYAAEPSAGS